MSYTASSCNVNGAQTVLTCYAVAGIGSNFTWAVTVAGQSSGQSQQSTSYPPPSLAAVSGVGAVGGSTAGGQIVTLTGLNFGPTYAGHTSIMNSTYGPVRTR